MDSTPSPLKAAEDARKGSVENRKGSAGTRKGSRDNKKSAEMKQDPGEAQKGPDEVRRRSSAWKMYKKWSLGEDKRVSIDSRVSVASWRSSLDSRTSFDSWRTSVSSSKRSSDNRRSSSEGRTGSSEDRDSLSSISTSVRPNRVPWILLMRALGRFKLTLPEIRRSHMLAARNPLAVDTDIVPHVKHHKTVVKRLWGDHQPLSKIPYKILRGHDHIDAGNGSVMWDFEPRPKAPVLECSITADNRRIVASSYDKTVRAWDVQTGQLLWKIRHDTFVVCCKFSPDGKYVLSALDVDRGICLMDPENITNVIQIKGHHNRSITACCFDPDSQKVASVSMDRCIKIWDITSQATLFTIPKAHANTISDCCFNFSGHFLCTSSWDKNIKIWNIHSGEFRNRGACVTLMKGHEGCVSSCCIARDSSFLISGGFDKSVAIWDVGDGYRKLSLKGHDDWVTDVAVSNSKKWILSASKDSSMRLWNIEKIDKIPLVTENKRSMGCKVKQCKRCDQLFSAFESDFSSKLPSQCLFCRREEKNLGSDSSSSSLSLSLSLEESKEN